MGDWIDTLSASHHGGASISADAFQGAERHEGEKSMAHAPKRIRPVAKKMSKPIKGRSMSKPMGKKPSELEKRLADKEM
jgi:hypothetical protein